ncbi:endonuclease domain-containing protein [Leptothrix sp. BB-3]
MPYQPRLKTLARDLRGQSTDAEQRLWSRLRREQVKGLRFNRQKPIAGYIVDFYCAAERLVIELDGSQHFEADAQAYDQRRTRTLEALGLRVLRFDNRQVLMELDGVMAVIEGSVGGGGEGDGVMG